MRKPRHQKLFNDLFDKNTDKINLSYESNVRTIIKNSEKDIICKYYFHK